MGHGFYLYGIFPQPGPHHLGLQGLDQQSVQSHDLGEFTVLYSEAQQERYLASRRNLLGHERVLEQAMEQGYRTLLPLQFGLVIPNWDTIDQQLFMPHSSQLQQLLEKLDGRREVGVKVFWDTNHELQGLMETNATLRQERDRLEGKNLSMDEIVRIGQAIEQAMAQRRQDIIEVFQATLSPLAGEIVENDPLTDTMIFNAAYLIDWEVESEFNDRVEALDQEFEERLRIRYNNFTAPFNFAQLDRLAA